MSIVLHGIGLGGGIVIGNAYVLDKYLDDATQHTIEKSEINSEIERFEKALKNTRRELELLRGNIPPNAPAELGAFLSLSIMMLGDSQISQAPIQIIKEELCNVDWALKLQASKLASVFDEMDDAYLKERKYDVVQVLERVFKNLDGNQFNWSKEGKVDSGILITHDLSPADLLHFKDSNFDGFITEIGSLTSHTAIVGRNLDVPSIIGVGYARQLISDNELVIVDGVQGVLIINPELVILNEYKKRQQEWLYDRAKLNQIRKNLTVTKDGVQIDLFANIESLNDIEEVRYNNADGIGLFRSEFLFLNSQMSMATEDEQFEFYYKIAKSMKKLPVTIRTADIGADKSPSWNIENNLSMNPALGLTGVRLSLSDPSLFRVQLRAILRASFYGNIQLMFPMVSSSLELKQALHQLTYAKDELQSEGVPFNANIKVGTMLEIPSAALAIKSILSQVDFISIGTNDLIQYLLAVDRNDEAVSYLYNPLHPAVLSLLSHIIKNCNRASVPVSLCGEMAGEIKLTRLLLGLGLRKFCMYSSKLLDIKNVILNSNISDIMPLVNKILKTENNERIEELLGELNADLDL